MQNRTTTGRKASAEDAILAQAAEILERRLLAKRNRQTFRDPAAVRQLLRVKLAEQSHELFIALWLDNQHQLIAIDTLSEGTIDGAAVYPREVAKAALSCNAAAVIFAHNHPSGVSEPSAADRALTERLKSALALLDIRVLDHFVVGVTITSFAERGWI
jgi:DNA repair protein RadC